MRNRISVVNLSPDSLLTVKYLVWNRVSYELLIDVLHYFHLIWCSASDHSWIWGTRFHDWLISWNKVTKWWCGNNLHRFFGTNGGGCENWRFDFACTWWWGRLRLMVGWTSICVNWEMTVCGNLGNRSWNDFVYIMWYAYFVSQRRKTWYQTKSSHWPQGSAATDTEGFYYLVEWKPQWWPMEVEDIPAWLKKR